MNEINQNLPVEPKTRFIGIFIPVEILELEELNIFEQVLLSWIDALYSNKHGGCFASNQYLAKKLRVKENTITKALTKLKNLGLVKQISFDGRKRIIYAAMHEYIAKYNSENSNKYADYDLNPRQTMTKILVRPGRKSQSLYKVYSKEESKEERESSNFKTKPVLVSNQKNSQVSETSFRLSLFLFEKLKKRDEKAKEPNFDKWAIHIERLIKIDGRDEKEIEEMIDWACEHKYWKGVVHSTASLRKYFGDMVIEKKAEEDRKNKKTQEEEKATKDVEVVRENNHWVKNFLKDKTFNNENFYMKLIENAVYVQNGIAGNTIGFAEDEFKDLVETAYRKII